MKNKLVICFLILSLLATSWSLIHPGFFRVHDYVHAARIAEMLRGIQDGQFPVRWSVNFGYGYGMPLFEFYAPLPSYIGAGLYWLGFDVVTSIKLLYVICSAVTFVSMYLLGKKLFGRSGGVVAAVAVTLAPYRAVNLFVRGAVSEAWGMMALPWVLLGIVKVIRGEKQGWIVLLSGLLVLFLSHNITTMIFFPFSVLFAVGYWLIWQTKSRLSPYNQGDQKAEKSEKKSAKKAKDIKLTSRWLTWEVWRSPVILTATYVLGIGLAAFYLFPAFLEKDYTKVNAIFGGYFYYVNHFLYLRQFFIPNWGYGGSVPGPNDEISFFLGYGQLLGAGVAVILWLRQLWITWRTHSHNISLQVQQINEYMVLLPLFVLFLVCALFMTLFKSQRIWDALPFMVAVQFPWRYLSIAATFLALVAGCSTVFIKPKFFRLIYAVALSVLILVTNAIYFRPKNYLQNANDLYYTSADLIQREMSGILPDYIPKQMPDKLTPPTTVFIAPAGTEKQVDVLINRSQEKLFRTHFLSANFLNFMIADFPGWTIEVDGKVVEKRQGQSGTFGAVIPAGEHYVSVYFADTPLRAYSDTFSLLSLIVFLSLVVSVSPQLKAQLEQHTYADKKTKKNH